MLFVMRQDGYFKLLKWNVYVCPNVVVNPEHILTRKMQLSYFSRKDKQEDQVYTKTKKQKTNKKTYKTFIN